MNPENNRLNSIICVFGKRGSGKSHFVKNEIIPEIEGDYIVFDPLGEYKDGIVIETYDDFEDYIKFCRRERKRIKAVLRFESDEEYSNVFRLYKLGNIVFVVEEIDFHCSANSIDPHLAKMIKYGRHYNCGLIAVSRRPAEVNRLITSQAHKIIVFQITEPSDLDYLKKSGFDPDDLGNKPKYQKTEKEF